MRMSDSIRIKANLEADSSNLVINLEQNFNSLEVLSLKLTSDEVYRLYNANYGILVGRVTSNGAFGIPNAKISIFIPISDEDSQDQFLKSLYPYTTPYDKNKDGIRYNLLPKDKQFLCHTPIGTFPNKNEVLDNESWVEVYDKYYKYNTTTNQSGDYMIVGIPIGTQSIHMDVDLSDIGFVSVRPYDLIAQGYNAKQFNSNNKFKYSKDIDTLPHLQSVNTTIDIIPFWGDRRETPVGITQLNFNLPIDITPNAIFFGSIFTDTGAGRVTKKCKPRKKVGRNCNLTPTSGTIEMIRKVSDFVDDIEYYPLNAEIDEDGNWVALIPMNLEKVVTDEFGNLVPSSNPNFGIPTRCNARFRINPTYFSYKFFSGLSRTASFLVPNMYNRFQFGVDTNEDDLFELKWKKIYTIRQYIPRYSKKPTDGGQSFLALKRIGDCDENYSIPYNRIDTDFNPLYSVIAIIITIIAAVMTIINSIPLVKDKKLSCNDTELEPNDWKECVLNNLADFLNVVDYEFYNDWLTGSLYAPLFSYKTKFKNGVQKWEKYCDYDCRQKVGSIPSDLNYKNQCQKRYITDNDQFLSSASNPIWSVGRGLVLKYNGVIYYVARNDLEKNQTENSIELRLTTNQKKHLMLATNIAEMGSTLDCDIDNIPYFIRKLSSTSYNENEEGDILFNIDNIIPNRFNRNAIQLISQTQTEQLSEFFDYQLQGSFSNLPEYDSNTNNKTDFVAFDRTDTDIRRYLCENQDFYGHNFSYSQTTVNNTNSSTYILDVDEDNGNSEIADFTYDDCACNDCGSVQTGQHLKLHPYYLYFGVRKNRNSFDRILKDYFTDC